MTDADIVRAALIRSTLAGLSLVEKTDALAALGELEDRIRTEIPWMQGEIDRRDAILDWLAENMPGALELCPYKVSREALDKSR